MAELHQVTINEPTQNEQITLEQQAKMQEEAQQADGAYSDKDVQHEQPELENTEQEEERPGWLPEKFESAEELASAYANLEKEYHAKERTEVKEKASAEKEAIQTSVNNAVTSATEEFAEKGELSEVSLSALESAGISREVVEMYVRGFQSVQQDETQQIMSEVGGKENYDAMSTWAAENLSDGELDSFNAAVETGDMNTAKLAINGLYARFTRDIGEPVTLQKGQVSGSPVTPFNSNAQVTEAMQDPRYQKDPAYREHVAQRLAVSKI